MTIDRNKVLEAQSTIDKAKEYLMLLVKQYFENGVSGDEGIFATNSRVNKRDKDFEVEIKAENVRLKVGFQFIELEKVWTYSITCDELEIRCFNPPEDDALTIQGNIGFKLKECANIKIGGEDTIAIVGYIQSMKMRKYSE